MKTLIYHDVHSLEFNNILLTITMMDEILQNVEILKSVKNYKITKTKEYTFSAHCVYPSDILDTSHISNYKLYACNDKKDCQEKMNELNESNKKLEKKLSNDIKYVICLINYPTSISALFKFDCSNIELTYGKLLYLHTYAYQLMYKLENEDICKNVFNSSEINQKSITYGRFGIFKHLTDLIYNGESTFEYIDGGVICSFDVNLI